MTEYTYKYRIYPNEKQKMQLAKTFGCTRFIYNYFLSDFNIRGYSSKFTKNNICNQILKDLLPFLKEVDKFSITNAIYNLDDSCIRYMNKISGKPNFKKKNSIDSYQTNFTNNNIEVLDNSIKLPKLGKVKAKIHRKLDGKIINATIKKYSTGKYYVMILVRKEIEKLENNSNIIALDMGVRTFVTTSDYLEYKAPKELLKKMDRLALEQRKLSRMLKTGKNFEKQKLKIAKIYEKCDNIRNNFLHVLSKTIINKNQVIIVEDLNVKDMFQNKMLSKVLGDISISKFINLLEYKAKYYGRQLIKINKYYPSSQICSNCGYQNKKVKDLAVRKWICPECGRYHSRDYNAAVNLLTKGLEYIRI